METKSDAVGVLDLSDAELYELVYHMRVCSESAPEETRILLQEQPEFARALAQAQLKLGMMKEHTEDTASSGNTTGASNSSFSGLDAGQQELLEEVRNLAPEVIQSLPPEERKHVMELREAMGLPPV